LLKRSLALLLGAALLIAGSCDVPFLTPASAALNLRDGQVNVQLDQPLILRLSRTVQSNLLSKAFLIMPTTDGSLESQPDGRSFTFRPTRGWLELTEYHVYLAGFRDSGGSVAGRSWTFLTTVIPRVLSVASAAGTAVAEGEEVDQGSPLTLTFNSRMNPAATTLTVNGSNVEPTWSSDHYSAGVPTDGLPAGAAELALVAGRDDLGHIAAAWKFEVTVAFSIHIATTHVGFPVLIQVPNDGYGARPQAGLQAAEMVFEYLTEGDITRLTALYTDVPGVVGPIRSGRRISFRLTRHYHGALFLSGLSNDANSVLRSDPVPAIFETGGFYRDHSRYAPNNLFISGDGLVYLAGGVRLPDFAVTKVRPKLSGGSDGGAFDVAEHHSSYRYDAVTGTYGKVEDGQQIMDAGLGQPVRAFMVVLMHTREFLVRDIESGCCTHGRDFDLDSSGTAEFWYRGLRYGGTWSAADRSSPFVFRLSDGSELTLPRGMVWVDVVGGG